MSSPASSASISSLLAPPPSTSASFPAKPDSRSSLDAQKALNEEWAVWRRHAPFLYDFLLIHALEWPSLTCEWLPDVSEGETDDGERYSTHRLLPPGCSSCARWRPRC